MALFQTRTLCSALTAVALAFSPISGQANENDSATTQANEAFDRENLKSMQMEEVLQALQSMNKEQQKAVLATYRNYLDDLDNAFGQVGFTKDGVQLYAEITIGSTVILVGGVGLNVVAHFLDSVQIKFLQKLSKFVVNPVSKGAMAIGALLSGGTIAVGVGKVVLSQAEFYYLRHSIKKAKETIEAIEGVIDNS